MSNECEHKASTVLWNNEEYQLLSCDWGCNGLLWVSFDAPGLAATIATLPEPEERAYDVMMDAFEIIAEASNE